MVGKQGGDRNKKEEILNDFTIIGGAQKLTKTLKNKKINILSQCQTMVIK